MFCPSCGTANPDSRFCINCGVEVNPAAQVAPTPQGFDSTTSQVPATGAAAFFKKPKNVLAVVGGVVLITGIAIGASIALTPNPLVEAVSSCSLEGSDGIELTDANKTLLVDTAGNDDYSGASYDDLSCILKAMNVPDRIINSMDHTRALDGTVTDSFDNISMSWRYHPDTGVDLTIVLD